MEQFKGGNGLSGLMGGKLASPSPARARLASSPGSALATPSVAEIGLSNFARHRQNRNRPWW